MPRGASRFEIDFIVADSNNCGAQDSELSDMEWIEEGNGAIENGSFQQPY
jgi:hypothetical protein